MRIKLDENLPQRLKPALQALSHDVDTVHDEGLLSQPDAVIVQASQRDGRVLFTLDIGLGDVRAYPPGTHAGIVIFRPQREGARGTTTPLNDATAATSTRRMAKRMEINSRNRARGGLHSWPFAQRRVA